MYIVCDALSNLPSSETHFTSSPLRFLCEVNKSIILTYSSIQVVHFHISVCIKHTLINQTVDSMNEFSCPHVTHCDGSSFPILEWTLPLCGVVLIPKASHFHHDLYCTAYKISFSGILTDCWRMACGPMVFHALLKHSTRSMVGTFVPIQFYKCSTHGTAFMSTNSA